MMITHKLFLSMNSQEFNRSKLIHLHRNAEFKVGISYVRSLLEKSPDNDELKVWLATFLYHYAFAHKSKPEELSGAIKILEDVIERHQNSADLSKTVLNARLFLAQIYSSIDCHRAISLATENYKLFKGKLTANRLADVFLRCEEKDKASEWYAKYHRHSVEEQSDDHQVHATLAVAYKRLDMKKQSDKWIKRLSKERTALSKSDRNIVYGILRCAFSDSDIEKAGFVTKPA